MKCPGQETQYWKPGAIFDAKCPECGNSVEFFKDDTTRKCGKCGHRFINPKMDFGCASYCPYAEQCIGDLPPELLAQKEDLLKDRVAIEMKRHFKTDFKRIGRTTRVARYAERIAKAESGNIAVILCGAYLHDIGDPDKAKEILEKLGAPEPLVKDVCDIVAHHRNPRPDDPLSFRVVYDARRIAELEDGQKENPMAPDRLEESIAAGSFMTEGGGAEARSVLAV